MYAIRSYYAEYLKSVGQGNRMILFYSAKNEDELIALDALKSFVSPDKLHIYLTRSTKEGFAHGRIDAKNIVKSIKSVSDAHFYICGGEEFTNRFKSELKGLGADNIYTDEW